MTFAVEHFSSGSYTYTGSPGQISSAQAGAITTDGANRVVVIAFATGRSRNTGEPPTSISIDSVTASGLTFTRVLDETYHYQLASPRDSSAPVAALGFDVFMAPAASQLTGLAWSAHGTGDNAVNNGKAWVFAISGLPDINAVDLLTAVVAQNLTTSNTNPVVPGVNTVGPAIVCGLFSADNNGFTFNPESGYTISAGSAGGHTTTDEKWALEYGLEASALSGKSIGDHSGVTAYWYGVVFGFGSTSSAPPLSGTLAATEAKDTFAGTGSTTILANLAATEAKDTFAGAGSTTILATLAVTEAKDTFAAADSTGVTGTLAATEAKDTFAAAGFSGAINAVLGATEARDIMAFTTETPIAVQLAATEHADHCRILGDGVQVRRRRRTLIVS